MRSRHLGNLALVLAFGCGGSGSDPEPPAGGGGQAAPPTGGTLAPTAGAPAAAGGGGRVAPPAAGSTGTQSGSAGVNAGAGGTPAAGGGGAPAAAGSGGAGGVEAGSGGSPGAAGDGAAGGGGTGVVADPGEGPAEERAVGYGRAATGGGDKTPVQASSLAELQAAVDGYSGSGGLVLEYTGRFDFGSISDPCTQHTRAGQKLEIKEKSDITLRGADGSAANFGIHIKSASRNIVIRNMKIGLLPGGDDSDMISLEGQGGGAPSDVWIDHNDLFSALVECEGAGDTSFDGMIDIKKGADNVTISYNYLHDHAKACLNGFSDSDSETRHVTFHHNVFENLGSRTPLQRHGFSHVLNNYYHGVKTSGINVRMDGYALIEGNFFEDVNNPVTSRDSDAIGYWELRDNNLQSATDVADGNGFGITWDEGNDGTVNATMWATSKMFPEPLGYDYAAHPADCVKAGLAAVVGPGKGLATLTCR